MVVPLLNSHSPLPTKSAVSLGNFFDTNLQKAASAKLASQTKDAADPVKTIRDRLPQIVNMEWQRLKEIYPDAFVNLWGSDKSKWPGPPAVYVNSSSEDKSPNYCKSGSRIAYVLPEDLAKTQGSQPAPIRVCAEESLKNGGLVFTIRHEMMHAISAPFITAVSSKYPDPLYSRSLSVLNKKTGEVSEVSIGAFLPEYAAEYYAIKLDNTKGSKGTLAYSGYLVLGDKIVSIVGEEVFRKAVLQGDTESINKVCQAAEGLQDFSKTNARADLYQFRLAAYNGMPKYPVLDPNISIKQQEKLINQILENLATEEALYSFLVENAPGDLKKYQFNQLQAVSNVLTSGQPNSGQIVSPADYNDDPKDKEKFMQAILQVFSPQANAPK